jgi:hypothetical protein
MLFVFSYRFYLPLWDVALYVLIIVTIFYNCVQRAPSLHWPSESDVKSFLPHNQPLPCSDCWASMCIFRGIAREVSRDSPYP